MRSCPGTDIDPVFAYGGFQMQCLYVAWDITLIGSFNVFLIGVQIWINRMIQK